MRKNLPRTSFNSEELIIPAASTVRPLRRRVCGSFRSKRTHGQQPEQSRIGDREDIEKSYDGCDSQRRSANKRRVYVRELDFATVMLLENTPSVLSLVKFCEEFGYSYRWTSGQKPHLIKNGKRIDCDTSNYVPVVAPGLSTSSSSSSSSTSPTSPSQETVRVARCA